jgi:hypothetical protein
VTRILAREWNSIESAGSRLVRASLWSRVSNWLDRPNEVYRVRSKRDRAPCARSPLMSWMLAFLTVRAFSNALGVLEVAIAIFIGLRPWSAKASVVGSAGAVLMFLTALSFLLSTPGWEPSLGGFPALSALPGQFLLKDVVLLGAALWSLGEAWASSVRRHTVPKS